MSELAHALQTAFSLGLEVMRYPSGKWGFAGRVPADLAWQMADGSVVPEEIAADIARASIRAYVMKAHGVSTRVFASREDAIRFAESRGYKNAVRGKL